MSSQSGSKTVVYAALAGNFLIAISKFAAAAFTGSSAMASEGVHSLVDTGNELLLLYGMHRAGRPTDREHPFGYGRELYFWTFMVAVLVFALGGGISIYDGFHQLTAPEPVENALTSYIVLGLSAIFEGVSWAIALREFNRTRNGQTFFAAIRASKDPTTFTVLIEDSAALAGLLIAFVGVFLAETLGNPMLDGTASILIGLLLVAVAAVLARESKGLLIGEQALPEVQQWIVAAAEADPAVLQVNGVTTAQVGPQTVVATMSAEFRDELTTPEIERCIERIERRVRESHPEVVSLFVKPQTPARWAAQAARIAE
jgi:cation diffusion facilitator family transporter